MKVLLLALCMLYALNGSICQITTQDSLWKIWSDDSQLIEKRLTAIGNFNWDYYLFDQPDSGFYYANLEYELATRYHIKKFEATALNSIGISFALRDNYGKAIQFYNKSLEIWDTIGDQKGIAGVYNNISIVYKNQGNYILAIEYLTKSLTIYEKIDDQNGISNALNNIGNLYLDQNDQSNALNFHIRSLEVCRGLNDEKSIAISLNNIGLVYKHQKKYIASIKHFKESLEISKKINSKQDIANALNNLGGISLLIKDYDQAYLYCSESFVINQEIDNKSEMSNALNNMGRINFEQGKFKKAIQFSDQALKLAQNIGALVEIREAAQLLYESYKAINKSTKALEMFELCTKVNDSIYNESNQKEIIHQKFKYEYEQKIALEDADHKAELEQKEIIMVERKKQQFITVVFIGIGLILTLSFLLVIFRRLKITSIQKGEILTQKNTIETILEDVTDSINYAKHLQDAILPSHDDIKAYFQDFFILYNPKDAVSGDFYWFETFKNIPYLAVADCTGHGVPGAMVSVVCSNALNRAIFEYGFTKPSKILDKARELIINTFEKEGKNIKDGMDIVLCSFENNTLTYSGANNPLWIVRQASYLTEKQKALPHVLLDQGYALIELKPSRQPVGNYFKMTPFKDEHMTLVKGDCLYFFTDGYADQFGGEKGRKFMRKRLKATLLLIQNQSIHDQQSTLQNTYANWKSGYSQIDDVCVIGVKIV